MENKQTSGPAMAAALFVAVFGFIFGILAILGKLPQAFRHDAPPIRRSFQRSEGELRRGR